MRPPIIIPKVSTYAPARYTVWTDWGGSHEIDYDQDIGFDYVIMPASEPTPNIAPRPMTNYSSFFNFQEVCPASFITASSYRSDNTMYMKRTWVGNNGISIADELGVSTTPDWMVQSSLTKALLKLRDGSVNLGVALAEARTCGAHLSSTVTRIARSVNNFRRKNPKKVWDQIRKGDTIPSTWLELQYGWTPLLNDIVGSAVAVDEAWTGDGVDTSITVKGREYENRRVNIMPGDDARQLGWAGTELVAAQTVLQYRLRNDFYQMFSSLGLVNPAEILWEVVPYSFVVDWFIPMGDWFSALSADTGWDWVQGCSTMHTKLDAQTVMGEPKTFWDGDTEWSVIPRGRPGFARGARLNRSAYLWSPTPAVVIKNPLAVSSLPRVTSGLALLTQAFRY